ncbi:MAG: class I SAM-dependent methyltransferase [Methylococcaceae bacterium]|nr:class I SAM-dependent methyltransferase [Methylococcaceae bacterium]
MKPDSTEIQKRYDRLAPFFDLIEAPMEGFFFRPWRKKLWSRAEGHHILEVGVGTGKNFDYYPKDARVTAIDFSPQMLKQAENNKARKNINVDLALMDVQSLCYADNSFDTVIGSFVFCSVPMPVKGLKELHRVCKPGGKIILLEHVISAKPAVAKIMESLNPVVLKLFGANINRDTVKNVKFGGFSSVRLDERSGDILKLIIAKK